MEQNDYAKARVRYDRLIVITITRVWDMFLELMEYLYYSVY